MSDEMQQPGQLRRPRPKYQVFISSTYLDLQVERRAVTWEVLKARHIPAGMESFTASDDRGWKTIQRTIDLSDYYILIIAGRYGMIDPTTEMSWTEQEYRYARKKGMRVLAFIREDSHVTADNMEKDGATRSRLEVFKRDIRDSHLCELWKTEDDLKARVVQALQSQIAVDEDSGNPRPGWYRGDELGASPAVLEEFARLSAANAQLQRQVEILQQDSREQLVLVEDIGVELGNQESPKSRAFVFRAHLRHSSHCHSFRG